MSGLFKKLNTLVKAKINDALDVSLPGVGGSDEIKPGPKLDREVKRLRERINEAIDHEDTLEARVSALQAEEDRLDVAANDAVEAGNHEKAREIIKALALTHKQREMAEADLRQHRHVAEELIRKVNMMEAAVADSKRAEDMEPPKPKRVSIPVDGAERPDVQAMVDDNDDVDADDLPDSARTPVDRINRAFTDAQSRISQLRTQVGQPQTDTPEPSTASEDAPSAAEVDGELHKRVSRLSKRPPKSDTPE